MRLSPLNYDRIFVTINDTIPVYDSISVTNTLIIEAVLTGTTPPYNTSTIKVYPNPTRDHVFISTGDYSRMSGYSIKISNQLGSTIFETAIEEPLYELNLSSWEGLGLYYIQLINPEEITIESRKIILQ